MCHSQYGMLTVCLNEGGRKSGLFYYMNDISVYLSRQRGGGVPNQKNTFYALVLRLEQGVVQFSLHNIQNSSA